MTSRVVPQILPGAALGSSAGRPRGSLAFPAAGNIQVIDAAGNVDYIPTSAAPGDAALLAATQTFTGVNTFQPVNGTRVANVATPLFDIDVSSVQTLTSPSGQIQAGVRITAPTFDAAAGPDLDAGVTLLIIGPPTGSALGAEAYSLAVFSGDTLLGGALNVDYDVTVGGNLNFKGDYTISNPLDPTSPSVSVLGSDYKIQLGGAGQINLDAGATGSVQVGGNAACQLGFYGHATTAQQVLATGAGATVDNVITALQALGLVKQA